MRKEPCDECDGRIVHTAAGMKCNKCGKRYGPQNHQWTFKSG